MSWSLTTVTRSRPEMCDIRLVSSMICVMNVEWGTLLCWGQQGANHMVDSPMDLETPWAWQKYT